MSYRVNEIFYSPQGEGMRAGLPHVFVRFAGCNQTCKIETHGFDCDTDFAGGVAMTAREIREACDAFSDRAPVLFTGGEPCLQIDDELLSEWSGRALDDQVMIGRNPGVFVLETNGSVLPDVSERNWKNFAHVTVSPKTAEHTLRLLEQEPWPIFEPTTVELRYVRAAGQAPPKPRHSHLVDAVCISPAFEADGTLRRETLDWCIEMVQDHPRWRLSVQQHKLWGVR